MTEPVRVDLRVLVSALKKTLSPELRLEVLKACYSKLQTPVEDPRDSLLKRYLDNHCQASDLEGTSTRCDCKLCLDTRLELGL